jgi:hypothetical protein
MNELTIQELSNLDLIRSRIFTIRGVQVMLDKCYQCDNVAVAAPCGGLRPIGKQTRRAKREPSYQVQFPMSEAKIQGRKFRP